MATRHEAAPRSADEKALVDVDLWILGAPRERFDEYEAQVREEYGWVPATIYNTAAFVQRYEKQARENFARALARR